MSGLMVVIDSERPTGGFRAKADRTATFLLVLHPSVILDGESELPQVLFSLIPQTHLTLLLARDSEALDVIHAPPNRLELVLSGVQVGPIVCGVSAHAATEYTPNGSAPRYRRSRCEWSTDEESSGEAFPTLIQAFRCPRAS